MSYTKQKVKKDEWKIELKPISQLHREIQRLVGQAADLIPPVWPIHSFTSFNPLVGLLSMKFEEAFALGRRYFSSHQKDHQIYSVNQELIKWCQTFLDEGQACITMPERSKGFYLAWSSLAPYDKKLNTLSASRSWLFSLPKEPEVTIVYCLEKLKVQENQRVDFFRHCLAELPGWAGYIKWKSEWQEKKGASKYPISLVDFLAVRLVITCILAPKLDDKYFQTHLESTHLDLEKVVKREKDFITGLIQNIIPQAKAFIHEHKKTQRCDAQLIFCMDTRSEPFRRSIEQIGNYETFGTAGFFGLPILVHQSHTNRTEHRCPVFLKPHYHICEQPVNQDLKGNIIEKLKKNIF